MSQNEFEIVVGRELRSAFLDDSDFRAAIREINATLQSKVNRLEGSPVQFGLQSAFNSFMVSSFHAARAIELTFAAAIASIRREPRDYPEFNFLMQVQHSYCLQAVLNLYSARQLFSHRPVSEALAEMSPAILELFDSCFPNLKTARDALAHDDERVFGIVRREQRGNGVEECQFISLRGTELGCKDEQLRDVAFSFPSTNYFTLISQMSGVLRASD